MPQAESPQQRQVRDIADNYVAATAEIDPLVSTSLGLRADEDRMPDLSPAGQQAKDELAGATLAELTSLQRAGGGAANDDEQRCARLLRERLEAGLALSEAGEHLRTVRNIAGPMQQVRMTFTLMPTATADDWAVIARRMGRVGEALAGYRASLQEGARRGLFAAARQVETALAQLDAWQAAGQGNGWFAGFTEGADVPATLRAELDTAAGEAGQAVAELRRWLAEEYLPRTEGTPDAVGEQRYRLLARQSTGSDLDLDEAYAWGWSEYLRLREEMNHEARRVLPGATVREAMRHLDEHGEAVHGVEATRLRLQQLMDSAIHELDHTHFDLAGGVRTVEAHIAPEGSAAAPYYTRPSRDFSRPGRTWLPTLGQQRFPLWSLASTWYHEGVPGHHLQLAQWVRLSEQLSQYQTGLGAMSSCTEGWALYSERLMDELGYLGDPGNRLGYLAEQMLRAIRVVIDIGMHLRLEIPADSPIGAGRTWTPELAGEFLSAHSAHDQAFLDSEIVRYLGWPGQAISYKLGERAWLAGREKAGAARGADFDLKAWHMSALSLGALGLDDLTDELGRL